MGKIGKTLNKKSRNNFSYSNSQSRTFLSKNTLSMTLYSHRFYNAMIEAPFSEDLDYSSDYLDEYHGRDAYFDSDEDQS